MLYLRPLADLTDNQLRKAFGNAAARYKPFGGSYPSPGELRDFAELGRVMDDAPEVLARDAKPVDWEPMSEGDRKWIEARVKEVAAQKAVPHLDYREETERRLGQQNRASQVPVDLAERRAWAIKKAAEMGYGGNKIQEVVDLHVYCPREPGDEA